MLTAADIIRLLDLAPHPEGGHFRETFRDDRLASAGMHTKPTEGRAVKSPMTAICAGHAEFEAIMV